ncbi:MAG: helix-turn-helix domain-containing protein [Salinarimonas sp.]
MAIVHRTLADLQSRPHGFAPEKRASLLAMTDEEIEHAASSDPDNPPLTEADFARMDAATRAVRIVLERDGMTVEAFARAFRIDPEQVAALEAGRLLLDETLLAYLTVIEKEPEAVRRALGEGVG